jgi:hypothetical protein
LVTVVEDECYRDFVEGKPQEYSFSGGCGFSFDKVDQMRSGITNKLVVSLTPSGEKLAKEPEWGGECRAVPLFQNASVQVISQEPQSDGVEYFVLIMAKYTATLSPFIEAFNAIAASAEFAKVGVRPVESERKVATVWKWDPIKEQWGEATWEEKGMSEELDMSVIRNALGNAR